MKAEWKAKNQNGIDKSGIAEEHHAGPLQFTADGPVLHPNYKAAGWQLISAKVIGAEPEAPVEEAEDLKSKPKRRRGKFSKAEG